MNLNTFNALPVGEAKARLLECCHCDSWVTVILSRRPFETLDSLRSIANSAWLEVHEAERVETFNLKPRLGQNLTQLRERFRFKDPGWDAHEQAGSAGAGDTVLQGLIDGNTAYEAKFGFRFILFATGKSAEEWLAALTSRLQNDRDEEICIATEENHKITELPLFEKWFKV